jgi:hypothetical protein
MLPLEWEEYTEKIRDRDIQEVSFSLIPDPKLKRRSM